MTMSFLSKKGQLAFYKDSATSLRRIGKELLRENEALLDEVAVLRYLDRKETAQMKDKLWGI